MVRTRRARPVRTSLTFRAVSLSFAILDVSASRLGHGPHLPPWLLNFPGKDTWVFWEKVPRRFYQYVPCADCPVGHSPGMLIRLSPHGSARAVP